MVLSNLALLCKAILKTWMLPTYFLPFLVPAIRSFSHVSFLSKWGNCAMLRGFFWSNQGSKFMGKERRFGPWRNPVFSVFTGTGVRCNNDAMQENSDFLQMLSFLNISIHHPGIPFRIVLNFRKFSILRSFSLHFPFRHDQHFRILFVFQDGLLPGE